MDLTLLAQKQGRPTITEKLRPVCSKVTSTLSERLITDHTKRETPQRETDRQFALHENENTAFSRLGISCQTVYDTVSDFVEMQVRFLKWFETAKKGFMNLFYGYVWH